MTCSRFRSPRGQFLRAVLLLCLAGAVDADDLQIFGYFQNAFIHETGVETVYFKQSKRNSFSVQQHNLFFQKDLDDRWRAFVNFEFLNSFSSARRWGSANLEEAWVRYRHDARFSIKLGQSIPVFNNLNEIKNRTPILPYIVRPLVYETSFREFIPTEEFLPERAFVQVYGFVPAAGVKLDYALFVGNGPNINDDPDKGQTGVDTTASFLLGGRVGLRNKEWKVGLSATRDHFNAGEPIATEGGGTLSLQQITRRRAGMDLSGTWRDWSLEAEWIAVGYDDDTPRISFNKYFYYATLGYRPTEKLFVYGSYWLSDTNFLEREPMRPEGIGIGSFGPTTGNERIKVPTVGCAYQVRDSIVWKAQFAPVDGEVERQDLDLDQEYEFNHFSTSISVIF